MTDEQFDKITRKLMELSGNQAVLEQKLIAIQTGLDTIINRQRTMGYDQEDLVKEVKELRESLNS